MPKGVRRGSPVNIMVKTTEGGRPQGVRDSQHLALLRQLGIP